MTRESELPLDNAILTTAARDVVSNMRFLSRLFLEIRERRDT